MEGVLGPSPSGSTARLRSFSRPALTLMELLVVVAIIAIRAGLLIPKIDWARRQANMAVAASSSADVASYIQMYIPSTDGLPNGFDSLVGTDGLIYGGPTGNTGVTCGQGGIIGILNGVGSIPSSTAATNIPATDKRWNSLFRMGLTVLNDHSLASTNATDSATVLRSLGTITNGTATFTAGNPLLAKTGSSIWKAAYPPNVWPAGNYQGDGVSMIVDDDGNTVSLACLGVGTGCSLNGVTNVSVPQFPGPNSNLFYYRHVAVFGIYSDGRRAQLKTVIDSFGRTIDSTLSNFNTAGPDDLPPGRPYVRITREVSPSQP